MDVSIYIMFLEIIRTIYNKASGYNGMNACIQAISVARLGGYYVIFEASICHLFVLEIGSVRVSPCFF